MMRFQLKRQYPELSDSELDVELENINAQQLLKKKARILVHEQKKFEYGEGITSDQVWMKRNLKKHSFG